MKNMSKLPLLEYLKLGNEQAHREKNIFKKVFFSVFGMLQMLQRIRAGRLLSEILQLGIPNDAIVLEAGFGHGIVLFGLSRMFTSYQITGYELDDKFVADSLQIQKKLQKENITIQQKNLVEMDDKNKFDLIYSSDVLEHIHEDVTVLKNFYQALKPNGILLLHLPLKYEQCKRIFPWFKHFDTIDHVRDEYTPAEIINKLHSADFHKIDLEYGFGLYKGELSSEINNLILKYTPFTRLILMISQLLTFPISLLLGYLDIRFPPKSGNSLVIKAVTKK